MHDSGVTLDRELTLFEYGTCLDPEQVAMLYGQRLSLQPYLDQGWLALGFDGDEPCIRATDRVGVLPFSADGNSHLLLIAPKGCQQKPDLGLLRFLELLAFEEDEPSPEHSLGWVGTLGPHRFLLFLARHYANLLKQLCRRDFRSYYRAEEDELRGFIRGRLHLTEYSRLAVTGKPHLLPCRLDEFTVDNWDNRILWAVVRRLQLCAVGDTKYKDVLERAGNKSLLTVQEVLDVGIPNTSSSLICRSFESPAPPFGQVGKPTPRVSWQSYQGR